MIALAACRPALALDAAPASLPAPAASAVWPAFTLEWARAARCVLFQDARLAKLAGELGMRWDSGRWVAGPHALLGSTQAIEFGPEERVFEVPSPDGSGVGKILVFKVTAQGQFELERYSRLRTPDRMMCARASVYLSRRVAASAP
ncbi:hypothetical protein [Roseateles paludis]|uniref:Uncharacterized protein n=1 Tax=Roseateles paludis TaxID=3145238 RepID=A0ABV0G399_9BURK